MESSLPGAAHHSAPSYFDGRSQAPLSPKQPISHWAPSGRVPAKFLGYLPLNPDQLRHSEPLNGANISNPGASEEPFQDVDPYSYRSYANNQPSILDQPRENLHDLSPTNTTTISPQDVKARRATVASGIPLRLYDEGRYLPSQDGVLLGSMAALAPAAVSTLPSYEYASRPPRGPGIYTVDNTDGGPWTGGSSSAYTLKLNPPVPHAYLPPAARLGPYDRSGGSNRA